MNDGSLKPVRKRRSGPRCAPADRLEVRLDTPRGEDGLPWEPGFYIFVRRNCQHWRTLLIRFVRRRDAELGRLALLREGLSTFGQLNKAGNRVHQIIGEAMQW